MLDRINPSSERQLRLLLHSSSDGEYLNYVKPILSLSG